MLERAVRTVIAILGMVAALAWAALFVATPRVSLDRVMAVAKTRYPGKGGMFVSQEPDDDRVWFVTLSDTPTSSDNLKQVAVDARTGESLAESRRIKLSLRTTFHTARVPGCRSSRRFPKLGRVQRATRRGGLRCCRHRRAAPPSRRRGAA